MIMKESYIKPNKLLLIKNSQNIRKFNEAQERLNNILIRQNPLKAL